jgi:ABC-type polysaccharide/polyol phosphate transport system ATPase subunit
MLATSLLNVLRRGKRSQLWAVRDVTLDVKAGECVGIIGRNGSGKSTLLQMVAGITSPTQGRVRVRGRIAPLISVGVGFHPELSGRDNLHVNGAILGLTRAEVNRRFDEVVAFAEMESFIDTPVKFYSSGMIVRLGFSMAIHATPDVLIVDEVLAVGDISFQMKCFDRMKEIREQGTTILVVSHNMGAVRGLCDRAMLLHQGQTHFEGDTPDAISKMHELLHARPSQMGDPTPDQKMRFEADMAEVTSVELMNEDDKVTNHIRFGEQARVRFHVKALQDIDNPFVVAVIVSESGVPIYGTTNRTDPYPTLKAGEERTYDIVFPARLATGTYLLRPVFGRMAGPVDERKLAMPDPMSFFVAGKFAVGMADPGATFEQH